MMKIVSRAEYLCTQCGKGYMIRYGEPSDNELPFYFHKCNKCGFQNSLSTIYPKIFKCEMSELPDNIITPNEPAEFSDEINQAADAYAYSEDELNNGKFLDKELYWMIEAFKQGTKWNEEQSRKNYINALRYLGGNLEISVVELEFYIIAKYGAEVLGAIKLANNQ